MTATAVETQAYTAETFGKWCEYRNHPCSAHPMHETLWNTTCECPSVWLLCEIHTKEIVEQSKMLNSRFTCVFHRTDMYLIAVNSL